MQNESLQAAAARRRRLRRLERAGFTIVELMIVITIIGLIAGGAAMALLPALEKAKVKQAKLDAKAIGNGVTMWLIDNDGCPTTDQLLQEKILDSKTKTIDPWNQAYEIDCGGGEPTVTSAGPDKQSGTEDDVRQ